MGRGRKFQNRSVRTEMKSLKCINCQKLIRLDEYVTHLPACKLAAQEHKISTNVDVAQVPTTPG
jgi:hypothetical protein